MLAGPEGEAHAPRAERLDRRYALVEHLEPGMALLAEHAKREHHVLGRDPASVPPAGLGAQPEDHPRAVGGQLHALGDEAVHGVRLVVGARHERLVEESRTPGRHPLEGERVERVVALQRPEPERPALGRVGVDVIEVPELGAVLEVAEDREAVTRRGLARGRRHLGGEPGGYDEAEGTHPP